MSTRENIHLIARAPLLNDACLAFFFIFLIFFTKSLINSIIQEHDSIYHMTTFEITFLHENARILPYKRNVITAGST